MPDRPTDASYRLVCLTLCQLRPASAVMRCQSATCRVVMWSKETASECRRQWPTTLAPTAALKHTSAWQWRVPVLFPSTVRQIAHDAAGAATNTIQLLQQPSKLLFHYCIISQPLQDELPIQTHPENDHWNDKCSEQTLKWGQLETANFAPVPPPGNLDQTTLTSDWCCHLVNSTKHMHHLWFSPIRSIMWPYEVIHKMEVHNISHCWQRSNEPRPQVTCTENLVKFGRVVFEICKQRDKQTERQTDILIAITRVT